MDANEIQKVYDVRITGGKETYQTLSSINTMFIEIAKNKTSLNGVFNINIDTSKFGQLDQSIINLIAEMKTLGQVGQKMAADISAAMSKVNMATLPNIVGFQKFQATLNPANIQGYSQAAGSLGAKLAYLKEQSANTSQSLKILGEQYKNNEISQEEYDQETARLTTQLQMLKTQTTEVNGAMTIMNKLYNPALIEEETIALAENRVELQKRNQLLKLEAIAEKAANGSRAAARAQISLLQKELDSLNVVTDENIAQILKTNLATDEEIAKQQELIATLDMLHEFVRVNSDAYTKQKINIGNYPQLKTEFAALQQQMVELVLAGKENTSEFKVMEEEAIRLAGSMKELDAAVQKVNISIHGANQKADKFGSMVERMGLRMLANLLIFQAAIELIQFVGEQYKITMDRINYADKAREEIAKNMANSFQKEAIEIEVLRSRFEAMGATMEDKKEVVEQLNEKVKDQYGAITNVSEAEQFFIDKSSAFIKALQLRAEAQANLTALTKEYEKEVVIQASPEDQLTWWSKLGATTRGIAQDWKTIAGLVLPVNSGKSLDQIPADIDWEKRKAAAVESNKALNDSYNKQGIYLKNIIELQRQAAELDKKYGFNTSGTTNKKQKQPHDYTNALLEAQKKLNDTKAKLAEENLQMEMTVQKQISDNTNHSLNERLKAYAGYATNEKKILKLQSDAQIKDVQDRLHKIAEIEKKPKKKRTVEENTLLINKDELNAQFELLQTEYQRKLQSLDQNITRGIADITVSGVSKMLSDIERDAATRIAELEDKATKAKQNVTGNSVIKEKKRGRIDMALNVDKDKAALTENANEQKALEDQIQNARIAKKTDQEKQLQDQLTDIQNKAAALREKLRADEINAQKEMVDKNRAIYSAITDQALSAFETIGSSYIQMLNEQAALNEKHAEQQIDWNKKLLDSQVQSKQQELTVERANYLAQQQMDKERLMKQKEQTEAEMGFQYALAVMKVIAANAEDFETVGAIEIAGITAAYLGKLAFLESQRFAYGGEVPSNGGMFGGRSHSAGGTPFLFQGGRFEAEAGELAIINKNSADSNQNMTVSGTPKQIASAINTHGGGYNFAPGAVMHKFEWGGSLGSMVQPPSFITARYAQEIEYRNNQSQIYNLVLANSRTLEAHASVLAEHARTLAQHDTQEVVLNPHHVTEYQNNYKKSVQLATL